MIVPIGMPISYGTVDSSVAEDVNGLIAAADEAMYRRKQERSSG